MVWCNLLSGCGLVSYRALCCCSMLRLRCNLKNIYEWISVLCHLHIHCIFLHQVKFHINHNRLNYFCDCHHDGKWDLLVWLRFFRGKKRFLDLKWRRDSKRIRELCRVVADFILNRAEIWVSTECLRIFQSDFLTHIFLSGTIGKNRVKRFIWIFFFTLVDYSNEVNSLIKCGALIL